MKALVYTEPNRVELQEREMPTLVAGEAVLRIDATGICGSDMHAYHGHDPRRQPGLVLGHEFAGTVVSSADERALPIGTRVTANPLITCGHCDYCLQGRDNLCSNRTMVGMTRPGSFSEFLSIPLACAIPLPGSLSSIHAALTEPAATALHAVNLSMRAMVRPVPEVRTLILGGGAIGMLAAALLRSYGCREVTVAETNPLRRASIADNLGCATLDPRTQAPAEAAWDLVIDAVGAKATRNTALAATRPGGVIMHIGLQDWASEIDMRKLTLAELTLLGTYTYTMADLRATVAALDGGAFGDLGWVETRALEDGAQAFRDLDGGKVAGAKVVLLPEAAMV